MRKSKGFLFILEKIYLKHYNDFFIKHIVKKRTIHIILLSNRLHKFILLFKLTKNFAQNVFFLISKNKNQT